MQFDRYSLVVVVDHNDPQYMYNNNNRTWLLLKESVSGWRGLNNPIP